MKALPILALAGLVAAPATFAAESAQNLPPAIQTAHATYISGGIGQTEATAMKHAAKRFPLEMEFLAKAKPHDEYTADIQVKVINNRHVDVINANNQGPFILAKIPDGAYRIEATENGITKVRHVEVNAAKPQNVIFVWNA